MKLEKIACAFSISILVIAFLMPFSFATSGQTIIYTNPSLNVNPAISPGQTITVDIMVANVTDLFSWQVKIYYNATMLNVTKVQILPSNNVFDDRDYLQGGPIIDNTAGYVWITNALIWVDPMWTFNGTGVLCTVTARVMNRGYTPLHFYPTADTWLRDRNLNLISASTRDGFFSNKLFGHATLVDFSKAYGSKPGDANWNPKCNFNWDDKADVSDLFLLGKNYG